ncbi:MAG: biotin carboxylase N-terminal domain-containing protein [Gammaproteobacteria bacterium]
MFDRLLIANRGEIACRIVRTARRMGIFTIAVYSDADAGARHVELADEAFAIGASPARESYLRIDRLLEAARRTGAQAIHPGYGFLSENAEFARACVDAGFVFVGPPATAIEAMGDKANAKRLMQRAGVPVVPGYLGEDQSDAHLCAQAARIGWPVLVKPVAGGGGKGMRVIAAASEAQAAIAAARREARSAFGDDRLLLERYLATPRHVEVQVFRDRFGAAVHLFERDCSLQRRHQKIVEEAPAADLPPETRAALGRVAIDAAHAVGYVGAGTVEFILDRDGAFHFMEMNTRLQVEHPVTEMITGLDLVEWQLRLAAGEPLPCAQEAIAIAGWAVEARICAEDPARDFLPATGVLRHLRLPQAEPDVRVDTGVRDGDAVTAHYDSMVAKVIARGTDRRDALRRLADALRRTAVVGVGSNLEFLEAVLAHPQFQAGPVDTGFIERHRESLVPAPPDDPDTVPLLAALAEALSPAGRSPGHTHDHSPWDAGDGWRLHLDGEHTVHYEDDPRSYRVEIRWQRQGLVLALEGRHVQAHGILRGDVLDATLDGRRVRARIVRDADAVFVLTGSTRRRLRRIDPFAGGSTAEAAGGRLVAPMPGTVRAVLVAPGDAVRRGDPLMVLEAMKMEHTIRAPVDGIVASVRYAPGDTVASEGDELLVVTAA